MQILKMLMLVGVLGLGYHFWSGHQNSSFKQTQAMAHAEPSPNGFIPTAMPEAARQNTVLILAPLNCPSAAAKRADALAEALTRRGIPNTRGASFAAHIQNPTEEDKASLTRASTVLSGEIPAVFINGMGKSNPSADDVAAEFERTK
ncbi:MAG: hypothetical protein EPO06_08895 [Burkholderiaceae bacterium]|nr:MAG: hypothetical protein EPO06_08895 [Burkholderiaceae bacterium]